jgi:transcription initiation factor IIE alpha subunit
MKKFTIAAALVLTIGFVFTSCDESKKQEAKEEVKTEVKTEEKVTEATEHEHSSEIAMATYQCSMKCEGDKTYDKPGSCPKCNMDLVKVEKEDKDMEAKEVNEEKNEE